MGPRLWNNLGLRAMQSKWGKNCCNLGKLMSHSDIANSLGDGGMSVLLGTSVMVVGIALEIFGRSCPGIVLAILVSL